MHAKCRHPVEKGIPLAKIQPFYRHGRAKVLCQWRTVESRRVEFVPAGHWKLHGIVGDQVCASCWLSFKPNTIHCQYVCSPLLPLMVLLFYCSSSNVGDDPEFRWLSRFGEEDSDQSLLGLDFQDQQAIEACSSTATVGFELIFREE